MNQRYEKGERSAKFLTAYAGVLKTADENKKFQEVADYYFETYRFYRSIFAPILGNSLEQRKKVQQ